MSRALERHEEESVRVIPVILRDVDWHPAPFGKLQPLPKESAPLRRLRPHNLPDKKKRKIISQTTNLREGLSDIRLRLDPVEKTRSS
jgi:hypothetical protein